MKWFFLFTFILSMPLHAVTLTLNLNRYKDSASTTCDWSTPLGIIQAPLSSNGTALDFGDGSDGDCNFSGTLTAREYKCRTLTVSGSARFTGTDRLIIRVQGSTTISGTLSVDGGDGSFSSTGAAGGSAGPGGFSGGAVDAFGLPSEGQPVAGGGDRGYDNSNVGDTIGGGGGAGGSRNNAQLGIAGGDGTSTGVAGMGGLPTNSNATFIQNVFETLVNFVGGSGGGGGGQGYLGVTPDAFGASGGGGGGVLRIISRGDITISGLVTANGGRGGNSNTLGGAGGGGSGGAIWLQTAGTLTNNGTIRALGGAGGSSTGTPFRGGIGGAGGEGRIRLDTLDGTITGNTSTPQASNGTVAFVYDLDYSTAACVAQTTAIDTIGVTNTFRNFSQDETLNGGTISVEVQDSADGVSWSALTPLSNIASLNRRFLRFRVSLDALTSTDSPELRSVSVDYDVEVKSDYVFKSDVSCGTTGGPDQKNELFTSLALGLLLGALALKRKPRTDR